MSKGTITAITPIKHGASAAFLSEMVGSLSRNSRVTAWAAACHPEDAPMVHGLGALHGIETLVLEEWGTNVAKLRNLLLSFVSTRYFLQADADDIYQDHALDQLAARLDLYPGFGGAFGLCTDFDSLTGQNAFSTPAQWLNYPGGVANPGELARNRPRLKPDSPFPVAPYGPHPGAGIFTTDTLELTGGYPEHDGGNFWDDVEHLGRVNLLFPVLTVPELPVLRYRIHSGGTTTMLATKKRWLAVARRLHTLESGAMSK
jgi:hypothetical protein